MISLAWGTKTTFRCNCENQWESTLTKIIKGNRCPECFPEFVVIIKRVSKYYQKKENLNEKKVKASAIRKELVQKSMFKKITVKVNDYDGKMLSQQTDYDTHTTKLKMKCKNGHVFEKYAYDILYVKTWCRSCGTGKKSIKDMHDLAKKYEGKCLSDRYLNNAAHLEWECKNGHIFKKTPLGIITRGLFCNDCSGSKRKLKIYKLRIKKA